MLCTLWCFDRRSQRFPTFLTFLLSIASQDRALWNMLFYNWIWIRCSISNCYLWYWWCYWDSVNNINSLNHWCFYHLSCFWFCLCLYLSNWIRTYLCNSILFMPADERNGQNGIFLNQLFERLFKTIPLWIPTVGLFIWTAYICYPYPIY